MNIGLDHAELVNTRFQYRIHVRDSGIYVAPNRILNVVVGGIGTGPIGHVLGSKQTNVIQFACTPNRVHFLKEQVQIRSLGIGHPSVGFGQCIQKHRILGITGKSNEHVAYRNFQNNVHSTTQIQAQVHFPAFYLFVGEFCDAQIVHRKRGNGVQIRFFLNGVALSKFLGLALNTLSHKGEGELVKTCHGEGDGK